MDEVLQKMESAIGFEPKHRKSSFEGLYKNWGRFDAQEKRRKETLENQKSNRKNKLDSFRGILDLVKAVQDNDIFEYKKVHYRPSIYVAGFNKASPTYKNVLMMSEWMIEKPLDFVENWYVTPCPKGTRVLVVASRGITKCYIKYGHYKSAMRSALPGGNEQDGRNAKRTCCVLDCFFVEKSNTMYVLDFLAWNNQPMTDCDTEFRHFWLQSQFAEIPELGDISEKNQTRFVLLPKIPCTLANLNKFMMTYPHFENNKPEMDGLLFYHKRAHYVSGETPLVGWLFPYMVQELLGENITVHEKYVAQKPADYVNQADFIQKFEEKFEKKRSKSRRTSVNSNAMDTVAAGETKTEMEAEEVPVEQSQESQETKSTDMEAEESLKAVKEVKDNKEESDLNVELTTSTVK